MEDVVPEKERCKRSGTKWRCPKRVVPGRIYCEKHHLYTLSRYKRNKSDPNPGPNTIPTTNNNGNVDSSSSSSAVEVYRPVIDFDEVGLGGNYHFALPETGNDDFTLGGLVGSALVGGFGELGWCGTDDFPLNPLRKPGFGGGNDGFGVGEMGWGGSDDFAVCKEGNVEGNDGFGRGFGQLGWSGNDDFGLGKERQERDGSSLGGVVKCEGNEMNEGQIGKVGRGQKRKKVELLSPKLEKEHDI